MYNLRPPEGMLYHLHGVWGMLRMLLIYKKSPHNVTLSPPIIVFFYHYNLFFPPEEL
jgi:hypothetical protein